MRKIVSIVVVMCLLLISTVLAENVIVAAPANGQAPLTVDFSISDLTTGAALSWDFDNDGIIDSTELTPSFTYLENGDYTAKATITNPDTSQETVTTIITVDSSLSVSITANPPSGIAPVTVQFTAAASGKEPLHYAWDFNADGVIDSTNQNPSTAFETAGENTVSVTVTDGAGNKVTKTITVAVVAYDSKIKLVSYFPTAITLKENQITFLISNEGKEVVKDLNAKVVGEGIQHLSSTTISRLKPGEQDSLTVKMNVLKSGVLSAVVKIDEKSFPLEFTIAEQKEYSKNELEQRMTELKQQLRQQEDVYYDKKAQNYLVSELFDSIKSAKKGLQDAQQQLLTNNLQGAAVALDLAASEVDDVSRDLNEAQKQQQTVLAWLKENAIAFTTIIAALGTLSGFIVKASLKAKKIGVDVKDKAMKLGENVKGKIVTRKKDNPSNNFSEAVEKKEAVEPENTEQKL